MIHNPPARLPDATRPSRSPTETQTQKQTKHKKKKTKKHKHHKVGEKKWGRFKRDPVNGLRQRGWGQEKKSTYTKGGNSVEFSHGHHRGYDHDEKPAVGEKTTAEDKTWPCSEGGKGMLQGRHAHQPESHGGFRKKKKGYENSVDRRKPWITKSEKRKWLPRSNLGPKGRWGQALPNEGGKGLGRKEKQPVNGRGGGGGGGGAYPLIFHKTV